MSSEAGNMDNENKQVSIITDQEELRKKSEPVVIDPEKQEPINDLIKQLGDVFFNRPCAGLSAPQIGIKQRAFIANLFPGVYVFINPTISLSGHTCPSTEGCLSLPGIRRTVARNFSVKIDAELIVKIIKQKIHQVEGPMSLTDLDAFIVQHEYDHLEGVLMIDRLEAPKKDPKLVEKQKQRQEKILRARQERKIKLNTKSQPMSEKRQKSLRDEWKRARKRDKISVEIQERYRAYFEQKIESEFKK